jgi:hypothetical protein
MEKIIVLTILQRRFYPEEIKSLCQSIPTILEQCAHLSMAEKLLDFVATLLSLNKCMHFVEGPKGQSSVCNVSLFTWKVLYEYSDIFQCNWWQHTTSIRFDVENDNCIEQFTCLLHQLNTGFLVLLSSLCSTCKIQGAIG